jgi:membrane protein involved in colicin uptake
MAKQSNKQDDRPVRVIVIAAICGTVLVAAMLLGATSHI